MTTVAAIFGALPLMLGTGVGSELRRPLGLAIVGGLAFSQVLTLYTTPVIYLFFERLGERLRHGLRRFAASGDGNAVNNRFSELFIRRPVATILLTIGIVFGGLLGYSQLPVSPLPQVDFPVISVQANMPGASPDTMATSVAAPLERHLGQIADVNEMTSQSSLGYDPHHPSVRPRSQHRRRRARRAGGDRRRAGRSADQPAPEPHLP